MAKHPSHLSARLIPVFFLLFLGATVAATQTGRSDAETLRPLAQPLAAIDGPGHHFGFGQASVLAQTTPQQTQTAIAAIQTMQAAPTPGLSGQIGVPCTTVIGGSCQVTGAVNGTWVKTGPVGSFGPNTARPFSFNATVPDGIVLPQPGPPIYLPTSNGIETGNCAEPPAPGASITCAGATAGDMNAGGVITVRFLAAGGTIDIRSDTGASALPTPTPVPPPPAPLESCPTRTTVGVTTVPDGQGRLQVDVRALREPGLPPNGLYALRFGEPRPATNASLDVGGLFGMTGSFAINISPPSEQVTFFVRPITEGQGVTVEFVAVDVCGAWPTLAGSGPDGLRAGAARSAGTASTSASSAADRAVASSSLATGGTTGPVSQPASADVAIPRSVVGNTAPVTQPGSASSSVTAPSAPVGFTATGQSPVYTLPATALGPRPQAMPLLPLMPSAIAPAPMPALPAAPAPFGPAPAFVPAPAPGPLAVPDAATARPAPLPPFAAPEGSLAAPPASTESVGAEGVSIAPFSVPGAISAAEPAATTEAISGEPLTVEQSPGVEVTAEADESEAAALPQAE